MKYLKECEESEADYEVNDRCPPPRGDEIHLIVKEINRWDICEYGEGEAVFCLHGTGDIINNNFHTETHQKKYSQGYVFPSRSKAETERDKRQAIATIQRYLRATQKCRGKWTNHNQSQISCFSGKFQVSGWEYTQIDSRDVYYDSADKARTGLETLRKEYEILFGVNHDQTI